MKHRTLTLLKLLFCASLVSVLAAAAVFAAAGGKGAVAGEVTLLDEDGDRIGNRSGVVVYLSGVPNALPDTSKIVHKVNQKDLQFSPSLSVVLKGSTVQFPNKDKIFHNVFSVSKPARFDLGLYKSGSSKSVTMKRTGVVDVYCNIHPQMVAKIVVLDTRYYAVTKADGRFAINDVPDGTYDLVAWQRAGKEYRAKVTIQNGKVTKHPIQMRAGKEKRAHLRKDGTPYGRYK